jgi:hypothetical protein
MGRSVRRQRGWRIATTVKRLGHGNTGSRGIVHHHLDKRMWLLLLVLLFEQLLNFERQKHG